MRITSTACPNDGLQRWAKDVYFHTDNGPMWCKHFLPSNIETPMDILHIPNSLACIFKAMDDHVVKGKSRTTNQNARFSSAQASFFTIHSL
mmetsp:Transcript_80842/g.216757  ORF Transcript_80842/g.216757 Transcript_80842/m.216757 type:complete len:91 (-) Transcript_80842:301-573(-)